MAPIRSARSRTCAADSSPVMYRTGAAAAAWDAAASSSVDLPTPGSPASRTTAPGTRPPPSTRSSSETPVGRARAASTSTSPIGRAGALGAPAATRVIAGLTGAPRSSNEPHAWHSGHRPSHLGVSYPQLQRKVTPFFTPRGYRRAPTKPGTYSVTCDGAAIGTSTVIEPAFWKV